MTASWATAAMPCRRPTAPPRPAPSWWTSTPARPADGWGGTDTLVGVRRVAVTASTHDTVLGSAFNDLFLSVAGGNKHFDGRAGVDEYRYAGTGRISVSLTPAMFGGLAESGYVLKPGGGTDRLFRIEAVSGGSGADRITGSDAEELLAGGAGADTLDGGDGLDTVRYDVLSAGAPLPMRGAVVNLVTGTATDPWGDIDTLRGIEHVWGSYAADSITGAAAVGGGRSWLRGLAGADTLRAASAGSLITADYAADPAGIRADLAAGTVVDGWSDRDTLRAHRPSARQRVRGQRPGERRGELAGRGRGQRHARWRRRRGQLARRRRRRRVRGGQRGGPGHGSRG